MLEITINVEFAAVQASQEAIQRAMTDKAGLHGSMAAAVEKEVKDHLISKYVPRNKHGNDFPPTWGWPARTRLRHEW